MKVEIIWKLGKNIMLMLLKQAQSSAAAKKRTRKLSDEVYNLVDVGGTVPKAPPLDQCVEAEVQPGETLASISLKYNIPVSELKRVNNIVSESHFYALKRIKIPVKAASLLTELLPAVHEAKGEAKWVSKTF